jgi:hypothetical protein
LCERHGAAIAYQRVQRMARGTRMEGNEFFISLRRAREANKTTRAVNSTDTPWH